MNKAALISKYCVNMETELKELTLGEKSLEVDEVIAHFNNINEMLKDKMYKEKANEIFYEYELPFGRLRSNIFKRKRISIKFALSRFLHCITPLFFRFSCIRMCKTVNFPKPPLFFLRRRTKIALLRF